MIDLGALFKTIVWDSMVRSAVTKLLAALILTPTGIVGEFVTWVALKATDWVFNNLVIPFVKVETIKLKNEIHQKQFDDASASLAIVAKDKGINSPEFAAQHSKEQNAFYNLVHFNSKPLVVPAN